MEMKNKIILIFAVIALNSCSLLSPPKVETLQQVYNNTKYEQDDYKDSKVYRTPNLSPFVWGTQIQHNEYRLVAILKKNRWVKYLAVRHYSENWKFLRDVYLKDFGKVESETLDRQVLDRSVLNRSDIVETVTIKLTDEILNSYKNKDLDFKISGDRGSTKVFITKEQLNGFLKKVEEDKRETIDEQW
jgi:hypothetical protein